MKNQLKVINGQGQKIAEESLDVVSSAEDRELLTLYLRSYLFGQRKGQSKVKTRGEVSGGGKKPWRQKGTGRARQGSIRSPLWRGGGVAHGPQRRDYSIKINRRLKPLIWSAAILSKIDNQKDSVFFLKEASEIKKTSQASSLVKNVFGDYKSLLIVSDSESLSRSFRNLPRTSTVRFGNLSPFLLLKAEKVIFEFEEMEALKRKLTVK